MLVVEFESQQYTGSESSGFVKITILGGSSTTPISVMINMTEQSATGEGYINSQHTMCQLMITVSA